MADSRPATDAELVAAARAGDMEAFACLAGRHRAMAAALLLQQRRQARPS